MARRGDTIYLGGFFEHVGGQPHQGLAAVDATTGAVLSWNPDVDSFVNSLVVIGRTVYVGGAYYTVGGQSRNSLAAVDALTGAVLRWNPEPGPGDVIAPYIYALVAVGDTIYVGGDFDGIGGGAQKDFAGVDAISGQAISWDARPNGHVWSLSASGRTVYAGGAFLQFDGLPCSGLAEIQLGAEVPHGPPGSSLALGPISPNPAVSSASIPFESRVTGPVSLEVFDIQGRRIATLLDHQLISPGWHEQPVDAENWPKGVYFCRLQAGGSTASRRFVVLR